MNLQQELLRIRAYITDSATRPSNEANTCSRVITPLLIQCGYEHHEFDIQAHDGAGRFPDYTILPDTQYTWFLEAKTWQDNLADSHVIQALNYAHTKGKRWVVLSNGREWRLYDDHIVGVEPAERLITIARLECSEELEEMLSALNKESVQSAEIERFALRTRLATMLKLQLQSANSELIKSITNCIRGKLGLTSIVTSDVVTFFQNWHHASVTSRQPPISPVTIPPASTELPPSRAISSSIKLSLSDLKVREREIQGWKPKILTFPDGTSKRISTWREYSQGIIEWLFTRGKIPNLPFSGQHSGDRYLITTSIPQSAKAHDRYKQFFVNGMELYLHVTRSATDFVRCLNVLCEEVSEPISGFVVTF